MPPTDSQRRLDELLDAGAITQAEYNRRSDELESRLGGGDALQREAGFRQWAMLLHLSQLLAWTVLPLAGIAAPIIIWQWKKADYPELDAHGKMVLNWFLSSLIYAVVGGVLILVLIGIPMLIVLVVAGFVFPIIGAVKGSDGELWRYPLTIGFFK